MQKSSVGTELDLAILGALELQPRIEFTKLAQILGVSSSTVIRRWEMLQSQGEAWTTVIPGARFLESGWSAFISIECDLRRERELAQALCRVPGFGTVALVSHHRQFHVDCFAPSYAAGVELLQEVFHRLPGVRSRHISPISRIYRQASEWSSGTLESRARRNLAQGAPPRAALFSTDRLDARIVELLSADARCSWKAMAHTLETSAQTVQRRTQRMLAAGLIGLRCDTGLLTHVGRREVHVQWSVPPGDMDGIGQNVADDPTCRVSAQTFDATNFAATLWPRDLKTVPDHEAAVLSASPGSVVRERFMVLRTLKRGGQVLDASGRRIKTIPIPLLK